jgi:phage tail-like protein
MIEDKEQQDSYGKPKAGELKEYYGGFHFRVFISTEFGGLAANVNQAWTRVSGIVTESEVIDYMRGTDLSVGSAPGRTKFEDLSMERVFYGVDDFYKWRRRIEMGRMELGDLTVELLNRAGNPVRRMVCAGSWPKRWAMPEMDASSSSPAVERITLAVADVYEEQIDT